MTDDEHNSVPPAPCPGTPDDWRAYLAEYRDWILSFADDSNLAQLRNDGRAGYEPADVQLIEETEERLGVPLPPSLRAFLLTSNGWGRVAGWIESLHSCAGIEWFTDVHDGWVDEDDESDDVFKYGLIVAEGEDLFLLDTSDVLDNGEYRAYLLAVKYGTLSEPCDSFSELLTLGRKELKETFG
ncbi:SMI1/KNR4 family protein [Amycolatopsis sp. EV170708-02-1]|uniref:SMI1/KNR4 family protein n=1 Tax=Amycolatopsis sp. EV170708-02-1 TaxID=2919322 RepID=UPI001F0C5F82|nr:SMI1/KNR4 family protein [Amycolatopsis sp. EV170708-02-1]UMP06926.1 SMI1/KNR4 family protein [Amycolatopsis sp. EV170708-02-1]